MICVQIKDRKSCDNERKIDVKADEIEQKEREFSVKHISNNNCFCINCSFWTILMHPRTFITNIFSSQIW